MSKKSRKKQKAENPAEPVDASAPEVDQVSAETEISEETV